MELPTIENGRYIYNSSNPRSKQPNKFNKQNGRSFPWSTGCLLFVCFCFFFMYIKRKFNNNSLPCPRSFQRGSAVFWSLVFFSLFPLRRGLVRHSAVQPLPNKKKPDNVKQTKMAVVSPVPQAVVFGCFGSVFFMYTYIQ